MEKSNLLRTPPPARPKIRRFARTVASCFAATFALSFLVAWLGLLETSLDVPAWIDRDDAFCIRARRDGGAAIAFLAVGTPLRVLKILVRLDKVVDDDESLVLFADELLRSDTLRCNGSRVCEDAALITKTTDGSQSVAKIKFKYGTFFDAAFATARAVGAEGELALKRNSAFYVGKTHVCGAKNVSTVGDDDDDALVASLGADGALFANASALRASAEFRDAPAASCDGPVELFPSDAADEQTWLALTSQFLFESSLTKLLERREVVERSLSCANQSETDIYALDCGLDADAQCRDAPSVPFRRVSRSILTATTAGSNAFLRAAPSGALARTSGALSLEDAVSFAVLRLSILILVSFVVYARASRRASGAGFCLVSTLRAAFGESPSTADASKFASSKMSDALVGVLAMTAHLLMIAFKGAVVVADGHADVLVWSIVGLTMSLLHFVLRNFVVFGTSQPLDRLGGSMALINASIATLLAFTRLPLLEASRNDFEAIARGFAGILMAVFAIPKATFAAASTAMLARVTAAAARSYDANYPRVLNLSSLMWIVQSCSLCFLLSRLFVVPQAYALSRFASGSSRQFEAALLLGTLCLQIPTVNSAILRARREVALLRKRD